MLALPSACVHEIDGFLSMADSVARSMSSKSAPAPAPIVGKALGGECIHQVGDGRRFILGRNARKLTTWLQGDPASGDGPAGLGALHIFQEGQGVGICPLEEMYADIPGLRLATSGWSVATWTRVKDGKLERTDYRPKYSYMNNKVGHALLAGGDVPAYYTAAPSPPQAIFDYSDFYEDSLTPKPRGNAFGCLVSTWEEQRVIRGEHCESDGEAWHFARSDDGNASLEDESDGWHHVAIVGDWNALKFYVDGMLAGTMAVQELAQGWSGEQSWTITGIGNIFDNVGQAEAEPWGALADFRVFNRKLSRAEIDLIYLPVATKLRPEPPATV